MRIAVAGATGNIGSLTVAARGHTVKLVPTWSAGLFGAEMAGPVLLPGDGARITPTTFDDWLATAS